MNLEGQVWGARTELGEGWHTEQSVSAGEPSLCSSALDCVHMSVLLSGVGVGGEDVMIKGWGRSQGISFNGYQ